MEGSKHVDELEKLNAIEVEEKENNKMDGKVRREDSFVYQINVSPRRPLNSSRYNSLDNGGPSPQHFSYSHLKSSRLTQTVASDSSHQKGSTRRAFIVLSLVFLASGLMLFFVYTKFPKLEPEELQYFVLPKNIDDAKSLGRVLSRYKEKYFYEVLGGVFVIYVFLQTFAIPGSIFLSILSGFLFPFPVALFLVCLCSSLGASFCYLLSYLVGRRIVNKYFPEKAANWAQKVQEHRSNLLNYIIFLRITPFLPNWFINITSPIINVPLIPFSLGTFIGVAPPSFIAIQAGTTLYQLTSSSDALPTHYIAILAVTAGLSLVPILFKRKLKEKFV